MSVTLVNPYCLLSDVQAEAQNSKSEDADRFSTEINKASRWIDEYCRRTFLYYDNSVTPLVADLNWCAGHVMYIPMPIIQLTKIVVDGTEMDASSFVFSNTHERRTSRIIRFGRWVPEAAVVGTIQPRRILSLPTKIELYGKFGFAPAITNNTPDTTKPSPDIPQQISTACQIIAAIRSGKVRREFVDPSGNRQIASVSKLPTDVLASLDTFKVAVV